MSSAVPKATSCEQCRKSKKGCTKELGGCSGCRVKGLVCIYPPETLAALGIETSETSETSETQRQRPIAAAKQSQANVAEQWTPPSQAAEFNSGPLANTRPSFVPFFVSLNHIINAMEAPMIFDETYDDWLIQDPDLMPTWEDFECVHKYFTTDPRAPAQMAVMDASGFMNTFFQQPPALRLVVTAMAAFCSGSAMTEQSAYWFFKRARKAVILAADRPSVSTAKAFYWVYVYGKMMRKYEFGLPFLKMAVDMVKYLKLDVDPDDSPWLQGLNLTEIEKEERRRLYWVVKQMSDVERSISLEQNIPGLTFGNVKPMRPIPGTFGEVELCLQFGDLRDLMVSIKELNSVVPTSIEDLLLSAGCLSLEVRLAMIQANTPAQFLSIMDFGLVAMTVSPVTFLFIIYMNFDIPAAKVTLSRPKLYLSALNSFDPTKLSPTTRESIELAIKETLSATQHMIQLVSFLFMLPEEHRRGITMSMLTLYPMFEASISAWFLICRMGEAWKKLIAVPTEELQNGMAQFIKLGETVIEGNNSPILPVMKAMLRETKNRGTGVQKSIDSVNVFDLDAHVLRTKTEPLAYIGLLGLEVAGGIQWRGRREAEWREFWTKNGMIQ